MQRQIKEPVLPTKKENSVIIVSALMLMGNQVKFLHPQKYSEASQRDGVSEFPQTTGGREEAGDLF